MGEIKEIKNKKQYFVYKKRFSYFKIQFYLLCYFNFF